MGSASILLLAALLTSPAAGPGADYRIAVVLLRFPDTPAASWGPRQMAATMRDVAHHYAGDSYGRLRILSEIHGWYTAPVDAGRRCPKDDMRTFGEAAVRAASGPAALDGYDAVMFVTSGVSCGSTDGTASIGGRPAYVWIFNGNNGRLISHELAHAFGRPHSRSRACSSDGCTEHEYGDPYDRAGCGTPAHHLNAAQKEAQGWLGAPGFPAIRLVTRPGVHWLDAYEPIGREGSVRALKIPTGRQDASGRDLFYYVESRSAGGVGRVLLHIATGGPGLSVALVDLAPSSPVFDAVLEPGQSFSDPDTGLTFRTLSSSADGSLVMIDFASSRIARQAD
jgi:hypothetical protein